MYTNLKMQIWKSGLRQNRIAQLLGMDETVLSKIVNGYRTPTQSVRASLAAFLNSDEAWLFQWGGGDLSVTPNPLEASAPQPAAPADPGPGGVAPSGPGGLQ